jgi:hypothetical protein
VLGECEGQRNIAGEAECDHRVLTAMVEMQCARAVAHAREHVAKLVVGRRVVVRLWRREVERVVADLVQRGGADP